jgi:hypothetical protein
MSNCEYRYLLDKCKIKVRIFEFLSFLTPVQFLLLVFYKHFFLNVSGQDAYEEEGDDAYDKKLIPLVGYEKVSQ